MKFSFNISRMLKKGDFKKILYTLFFVIYSAALTPAEFIFGSLPFGIAITASATEYSFPCFIGALIGALFTDKLSISYIAVLLMLFALKLYIGKGKFKEKVYIRVIESGGAAVFLSIGRLIVYNSDFTNILSCLITVLFSTVLTFLFSVYKSDEEKYLSINNITVFAYLFCGIYVLHGIDIYGFYADVVVAYLATVAIASKEGFMKGGIAGLICGLACKEALIFSPLLGICGIVCGILCNYSDILSICAVLFVSVIYGIYAVDIQKVEMIFQNAILVIILFVPLSIGFRKISFVSDKNKNEIQIYDFALPTFASASLVTERISKLSKAYDELSDIFFNMSKHRLKPTNDEVSEIIKTSMKEICAGCNIKNNCKYRKECLKEIFKLSKKYFQQNREIPISKATSLPENCKNFRMLEKLNKEFSNLLKQKNENDSCLDTAKSMQDISKAIAAVNDERTDLLPNPEIAEKVSIVLSEFGINNNGVYAQGKRGIKVYVYNVTPLQIKLGAKQFTEALSKRCGIDFYPPSLSLSDNSYTLLIERKCKFIVDFASSQLTKNDENICGDSICNFRASADFYSIICDGMGSGTDAACTSRMACIMLNKLVDSGCSVSIAIDMINKLLMKKYDEVFTTLDILQIDLFSGEASLYKAGAASSLIIRNGKKYEVSSKSTPIGIIDEFDAENIKLRLFDGDCIIMFSDGYLEAVGGCEKVFEVYKENQDKTPDEICNTLLKLIDSSIKRKDDISVFIAKVSKVD